VYYNLPDMVEALERSITGSPTKTLSIASMNNMRAIPGSNTLLLCNPSKQGRAVYAASDLRSFTATARLHFPETRLTFGIAAGSPEKCHIDSWALSRDDVCLFAVCWRGGSWHTFGKYPLVNGELRVCFASGSEPRLAYSIDNGSEIDITREFTGEFAIPPNTDMHVFLNMAAVNATKTRAATAVICTVSILEASG
jgi:hypothetical protein